MHTQHLGRLFVILAALTGLLGSVACAQSAGRTVGQREYLVYAGIQRSYVVRAPLGLVRGGTPVPLVLVLHGGGGNALNAEAMTGFTEKAREEGFIVVYPEGTARGDGQLLTWNAGHCCGYAMTNRVKDVGFINALIDKLLQEYPVDSTRIYATGMSNGGMMAHRLGIELSDRFAAVAPVVAALFGDEPRPSHPVSALTINGLLDDSVPPQGGPPGGRFARAWDGTPALPYLAQAAFWADANACANLPNRQSDGVIVHWRYRCPAGLAVESYMVKDNGHAWPGGQSGSRLGDEPSTAMDATDVIWTFFEAHPKAP